MADAATVNTLKDITKALQDQNRVLKDIHKALYALNTNVVEAVASLRTESVPRPMAYGWLIAETKRSSGLLNPGDIMLHEDGRTVSAWNGHEWVTP